MHLANYSVNAIILLVLQLRSVMDALKTLVLLISRPRKSNADRYQNDDSTVAISRSRRAGDLNAAH